MQTDCSHLNAYKLSACPDCGTNLYPPPSPSVEAARGCLDPERPPAWEIRVWATALLLELHDRDYWPNEATMLADALRLAGADIDRLNERLP